MQRLSSPVNTHTHPVHTPSWNCPPPTLSPPLPLTPHPQASIVSDLLVFNQVKQRLGGRVRVIVSGGAPLSPAIEEFLRVAMCCPVVQVSAHEVGGV